MFDALAILEGGGPGVRLTGTAAGRVAKSRKQILDADPGATPEEIKRRVANYRLHFPTMTLSALALAGHWQRCKTPPAGKAAKPDFEKGQF